MELLTGDAKEAPMDSGKGYEKSLRRVSWKHLEQYLVIS